MKLKLTKIVVAVVLLVSGVFIGWKPTAIVVASKYPLWSWRYGTPRMQATAAQKLVPQIYIGMNYEDVVAFLGPGSNGWPWSYNPQRQVNGTGAPLSFNVRAPYHNGIDVFFENKKVVRASYYD
jgi:hypothetical protein